MTTTAAIDLGGLVLGVGGHRLREDGVCLLEAVAWLAGEPHSDAPDCCCEVLASFGRCLNDWGDDGVRAALVPLVPRLVGTRAGGDVARRRSVLAVEAVFRTCLVAELEHDGRVQYAALAALWQALPPLGADARGGELGTWLVARASEATAHEDVKDGLADLFSADLNALANASYRGQFEHVARRAVVLAGQCLVHTPTKNTGLALVEAFARMIDVA